MTELIDFPLRYIPLPLPSAVAINETLLALTGLVYKGSLLFARNDGVDLTVEEMATVDLYVRSTPRDAWSADEFAIFLVNKAKRCG